MRSHNTRKLFLLRGVLVLGMLCLLLLICGAQPGKAASDLVINEILVSNLSLERDPQFNNYSGWIEIYNGGSSAVNLQGYSLTDDLTIPDKWVFGSKTLAAGGYFRIWTDDQDSGNTHTNFVLRHLGEDVGLFDPAGQLVDGFTYGEQVANVSYGRQPNGGSTWVYFQEPTPQGSNNTAGLPDQDQAGAAQFSHEGGFISSPISLNITPPSPSALVTYTLDGTEPTENSPQAAASIAINQTTVVRARAFEGGLLDGPVVTHSYLYNEGTTLPVVSLVTDPGNFFDDEYGIYVIGTNGVKTVCADYAANFFQEWERSTSLEYFEADGTPGFSFDAGVKIQGSCSRVLQIKGLDISLSHKYGLNELNYNLFPGYGLDHFKSFILRPSGQDQDKTMFRDGLAHMLVQNQMDIDSQAYRPVVVFINGAYWGIHNIREKLYDEYVEAHHNEEDIDLLRRALSWIGVQDGDTSAHLALEDYVRGHDLSNPSYYTYVADRVDIGEFINYEITRIYYATFDWPYNNIRVWRPRRDLGQWRWMAFDVDQDLRYPYRDSIGWAADPNAEYEWSTLFLRKLLENEGFRDEFLQRFASHMNITYEPGRYIAIINSMQQAIAEEMPRHIQRWGVPTAETWEEQVGYLRTFASQRPGFVTEDLLIFFNLPGMQNLTISTVGGGRVLVNEVAAPSPAYSGPYFMGIPVRLEAVPEAGNRFVGWQELGHNTAEIVLPFDADLSLTAVFEELPPIIINEIHYNPQEPDADYEFLELVNNNSYVVDLSGFTMADGVDFTFPAGVNMEPGAYILLAKNAATYSGLGCPVFQWVDTSLANEGETVELDDADGNLIDIVAYDDEGAWPVEPDGDGPSLELINVALDNSLAGSWSPSLVMGGTPCAVNSNAGLLDTQVIPLPAGWNMISTHIEPVDGDVAHVLAGVAGNMVLIKNGDGQVYWPGFIPNQMGNWDVTQGYKIFMTSADTLTVIGSQVDPAATPVPLLSGWNLVGYLPDSAVPADQALAGISGSLVLAKNGLGELYWPAYGINQIGDMQPGEGYQLYASSAGQLVYP